MSWLYVETGPGTPHTLLYLSTESQCRVCAQPLQKAVSVIHDQVVADIQPSTYNLQPTIYRPGLPDPLPLAAPSPAPRAGDCMAQHQL